MERVSGGNRHDGWYKITPQDAVKLLNERVPNNRPLNESRAQAYAADMLQGKWKRNGESLVFNEKQQLLDGQHRMRGCVLADTPFTAYCVYGVGHDAFDTIDQGASRSGADVLGAKKVKNATCASALINLLLQSEEGRRYIGGHSGSKRITNQHIHEYWAKHKAKIEDSTTVGVRRSDDLKKMGINPRIVSFIHYVAKDQHREKIEDFIEKLSTGENIPSGSVITVLKRRLLDPGGSGSRVIIRRNDILNLVIKAWCIFRDNQRCKLLRVGETEMPTMFSKFNVKEL